MLTFDAVEVVEVVEVVAVVVESESVGLPVVGLAVSVSDIRSDTIDPGLVLPFAMTIVIAACEITFPLPLPLPVTTKPDTEIGNHENTNIHIHIHIQMYIDPVMCTLGRSIVICSIH